MSELDAESIATLIKGGVTTLSVALGSKPAAVFIEKISGMVGWAIEPTTVKRKARAEAAASIIKAEADQEIKAIEQRAAARIVYEETKFQQNIENIVLKTLSSITNEAKPYEVDDDWLTNFFEKCRRISNEEMHKLWAQLLAGEINKPGSFSARTINFLATINSSDARMIRELRSYMWETSDGEWSLIIFDAMFLKDSTLNLIHEDFLHLHEIGVVNIYNPYGDMDYVAEPMSMRYGDRVVSLVVADNAKMNFGIMRLTDVGLELMEICDFRFNHEYYISVLHGYRSLGFLPQVTYSN